jgi:GT2 family glycosyltransferase
MKKNVEKMVLVAKTSGLFDSRWYTERYPDVDAIGLDPVEHYFRIGADLQRDPSPHFDSAFYLHSNPDVARAGVNPFFHFLQHGRKEGRRGLPTGGEAPPMPSAAPHQGVDTRDMHGNAIRLWPTPVYQSTGKPDGPGPDGPYLMLHDSDAAFEGKVPDIGVHVHVHYVDLIGEVASHLANVPCPFHLYVSVHRTADVDTVSSILSRKVPQAALTVRVTPNVGRDIAPFVVEFGEALKRHELVAHLHTKRSPHNGAKVDWRSQLLGGLLGSKGGVGEILRLFRDNAQLGMVFPEYHWSLKGQISWGTNYAICARFADRFGVNLAAEDAMVLFPAGSMFWARVDALTPLFNAGLTYADFPGEAGQVDGTLAHAIERLFGEMVASTGRSLLQVRVDRPHNLRSYYPHKWPYPMERALRAGLEAIRYQAQRALRTRQARVVVCTALAGKYESLLPQLRLDPDIDYVAFCDSPINDCGVWSVRPMDYWNPDPVRMARYVKTHPHKYFRDYDYVIWIDANVLVECDLQKYLDILRNADDVPLAGIPHPMRNTIAAEAVEVVAAKKDDPVVIDLQMERYREAGFPDTGGLIETNFMITNLRHRQSEAIMLGWWNQIEAGSRRDQLSLNYVLWRQKAVWVPLLQERKSLRNTDDFAYLGHGKNSGYPVDLRIHALGGRLVDPYAGTLRTVPAGERPAMDIVICVHDALDDVARCIDSVLAAKRPDDRVLVVDDASGPETADYLDAAAARHIDMSVLRNPAPARGYCKSANTGLHASTATLVLLLNSDTVVPAGALDKLAAAMAMPGVGIVGPMSNAASFQSLPDVEGSAGQTAINTLPGGYSAEDMDRVCAAWSAPVLPSLPLVHGFCQLIHRDVIVATGGFDEDAFPHGYGEENDLCFRATDLGFDLRIATDAFVFHRKSASYSDDERRTRLMREGAVQLRRKHSEGRVARAVAIMKGHVLLERMRVQARALVVALDE